LKEKSKWIDVLDVKTQGGQSSGKICKESLMIILKFHIVKDAMILYSIT
jgi:hypothetical protein